MLCAVSYTFVFYIYEDVEVIFLAGCDVAFSINILRCGNTEILIVKTMSGVLHTYSVTMDKHPLWLLRELS